ncbi:MAG TPA: hypothetical protein VK174_11920 [Chitinophagales bacterium]|nr:hypothetical protein [Chitinophagales bacterium]
MKASINSLYHQEIDWLRELEFYSQETDLLVKRLNELAPYLEGDNKKRFDGFLTSFANIKQQCLKLKKENEERCDRLNQMVKADMEHIDDQFTADKDEMHQLMQELNTSFSKTRYELNTFLVKGA